MKRIQARFGPIRSLIKLSLNKVSHLILRTDPVSLVGYSSWGRKESDITEHTQKHTHTHTHTHTHLVTRELCCLGYYKE